MTTLTPDQFADRLDRLPEAMQKAAERSARRIFDRIGARAVGTMRPSGGAPVPGRLTMRTGSLAKAVRGRTPWSIEEVRQAGRFQTVLRKGVRAARNAPGGIPGARVHELGGTTRPGVRLSPRPYLRPAVEASKGDVKDIYGRELDRALIATVRTGSP